MSTRIITHRSPEEKANWLDAMSTLDARLPVTRALARRFAMSRYHDPNEPGALARDFHKFVRDSIKYVRDPAAEEFSDSDVILLRGYGDCDDKARLYVALCRSVGIIARTRPCYEGDHFAHVQTETLLGAGDPGIACHLSDPRCRWSTGELIVRGLDLGDLPPRKGRVLA